MPRRAKQTYGGAPAQAKSPIPGQTYGKGVEQDRLERAMPTPQLRTVPDPSAAPTMAPAQVPAADPYETALAAAASMRGQTGLLAQPSARPMEPLTAGLSTGPGPGPEALGANMGTPAGDLLRRVAAETGMPYFAHLADRARA